ncbi:MAG TPA: response regulator transcription factor [Bacillota bacterium]|nr:response regulator transcription factor [Bacillota bacterium]
MRIVIVDDHPVVRSGLEQAISGEPDMEVAGVASSTGEGIAIIKAARPDLAVVDLRMPGGGGLELIRQCRKKVPGCRYVILTSYASYQEISTAFAERVEGYILKDALPEELITAIRVVAGGRRYFDPQAMDYYLNHNGQNPLSKLTSREVEILHCLAAGLSNRDMAQTLYISENTVKKHISNLLAKLELEDRTQAALFAVSHGMGKNLESSQS